MQVVAVRFLNKPELQFYVRRIVSLPGETDVKGYT